MTLALIRYPPWFRIYRGRPPQKGSQMKIIFNRKKSVLEYFVDGNIILLRPENSRNVIDEMALAKLYSYCILNNIHIKNPQDIWHFTEAHFKELRPLLVERVGFTMHNLSKEYSEVEMFRTILQYMNRYNGFDIPEEFWINFEELKPSENRPEYKEITINYQEFFMNELGNVLGQYSNPTSRDNQLLLNFDCVDEAYLPEIVNRQVLEIIADRVPYLKFKAQNAAQLRIFAKNRKLKQTDKTLIMEGLSKFAESDVLDDFATHKKEWYRIEKAISPTKARYFKKYNPAVKLFAKLKSSQFSNSNNSKADATLNDKKMGITEKFIELSKIKSPQYAIRNLIPIINKTQNLDTDGLLNAIISVNPKLKQLIELYNALKNVDNERTIKLRQTYYTREYSANLPGFVKLTEIVKSAIKWKFERLEKDYEIPAEGESFVSSNNFYTLPISTDNFYAKRECLNRGTKIDLSGLKSKRLTVFVAWKRKDNAKGDLDIDLSAIEVKPYKSLKDEIEKSYIGYHNLQKDHYKHSGDFTSCIAFNPDTGFITSEMISFNAAKVDGKLHFVINTYSGENLKDYDVYAGIVDSDAVVSKGQHSKFRLDDAFMKIKIDADFVGFYHLFALEGNELTLTGTMISSQIGTSAASTSHVCEEALRHCKSLRGFGVIDYFKLMRPEQQTFDAAKMDEYFREVIEK